MNLSLTVAQVKVVRRALSHLRRQASASGGSGYDIDTFCRADFVERADEIINIIDAKSPNLPPLLKEKK